MIIGALKRILYSIRAEKHLSKRRLKLINSLLQDKLLEPQKASLKVLDIGCATGKDFVCFFKDRKDVEITGIDLRDCGLRQSNFNLIVGDASKLPYPDSYFDITVSIGVLEHIAPMEKLSAVVKELNRVSKTYVVIVPSVGTIIEPHVAGLLWHLRNRNNKRPYFDNLLYMSDEAWLAFEGFKKAHSRRFWHIWPFVNNLVIYKDK